MATAGGNWSDGDPSVWGVATLAQREIASFEAEAEGKVEAAEGKAEAAEGKAEAAEGEVEAAKRDVGGAERKVEAAKWKVEAAERKVEAAERKVEAAERKVEAAERKVEAAEWKVEAAERKVEAAERKVEAAERKVEAAERKVEAVIARRQAAIGEEKQDLARLVQMFVADVETAQEGVRIAQEGLRIARRQLESTFAQTPAEPLPKTLAAVDQKARSQFEGNVSGITLSNATATAKDILLSLFTMIERGGDWPKVPDKLTVFPGFQWQEHSEDHFQNRTAYMAHLRQHVKLPEGFSMCDCHSYKSLLNVEMGSGRLIKGTTDVVVSESFNIKNRAIRNNVHALVELKKPGSGKDHEPQAVCELFAASYLSDQNAVVSVLTDLNSSWSFYWFAQVPESDKVALYKLIMEKEEESASKARYILESLRDASRRETLPTTLVDRLSFEQISNLVKTDEGRKRRRSKPDSGGGSSQDEKLRRRGERDPPSPSSTEGESSSGMDFQDRGHAGESRSKADIARSLRLFAPNYCDVDVADELDLLDMVDEDEQYNIVRSFAAKHIVPFMKGCMVGNGG